MQLKLRSALVIGKADALRRVIVQFLKNQGWIVHGMNRVELAVPILAHIPYSLIVIDSGLSTTVQDQGRPGYREWGVGPGGAFDRGLFRRLQLGAVRAR